MTTVTVSADARGALNVRTAEPGSLPHRRVIEPGRLESGLWIDTDLTQESVEVRDAAAAAWTPEIKADFEAALRSAATAVADPAAQDQAYLNAILAAPGSVVRALAEVMFAEINKLRVKTGDAAYTKLQFVAALKAKMRG